MKFLRTIAYVLALNFLAVAGGLGYLWKSRHLDRLRLSAIKAIVFPPAAAPVAESATAGSSATTQPTLQLDELLSKAAGLSAEEQVQFLQRSFDARMAELDVRQRQLADQQRQIDFGGKRLADDRAALDAERKQLTAAEQQAAVDAGDQGFQDSLALYTAMPAKQVKTIFMTLTDDTMMRYLEAMPPRTAAKIMKEFKAPEETDRIQKVLERMRQRSSATQPAGESAAAGTSPIAP